MASYDEDDDDYDRNDYPRGNRDNYRSSSRGEEDRDMGSLLGEKIGVDKAKGSINVFGKTINVGALAYVISPFYETFMVEVSKRGGKFFEKAGYTATKFVTHNEEIARGTGAVTGGIWRYGSLGWDIAADASKTIRDGFKDTRDAAILLRPYLAANHDRKTGTAILMSDQNPGVQNLRRAILARSKAGMVKHFTGLISRAPSLMLSYWQAKQHAFEANPDFKNLTEVGTVAQEEARGLASHIASVKHSEKFKEWKKHNISKDDNAYFTEHWGEALEMMQSVGLKNTLSGLRGRDYEETMLNQAVFGRLPFAMGPVKQFINEQFPNKTIDKDALQQFAVVKIAKLAESLKKHPCEDERELAEEIKGDFVQHFKDSGFKFDAAKVDKKLSDISAELANAIKEDDLNPYALVDLVCGNTLVKYTGGALEFSAKHDRKDILDKVAKKYSSNVDNQAFYKEVKVDPKDLKKIYDSLSSEERKAFVMMLPVGTLEDQGVDKKELKAIRRTNQDEFIEQVGQFLGSLKDLSSKDLQTRYGMSEVAATQLLSMAEDFSDAQEKGARAGGEYLSEHKSDLDVTLVKAAASAKKPTLWQELVGKKQAKEAAELSADEDSDERSAPSSRKDIQPRSLKDRAADREDSEQYLQ